jgi:hypothetical protein
LATALVRVTVPYMSHIFIPIIIHSSSSSGPSGPMTSMGWVFIVLMCYFCVALCYAGSAAIDDPEDKYYDMPTGVAFLYGGLFALFRVLFMPFIIAYETIKYLRNKHK